MKDLYYKNHKTLKKEMKNSRMSYIHNISRINIVKMATLLKAIYRFNSMHIKIPMTFSLEIKKKL
jgi:hypothetical protein